MTPYRGNRKTIEGMKQLLLITLASCVLGVEQELATSPRIATVSVSDKQFITKCKKLCSQTLTSCKPGSKFLCENTCEATAKNTGGKQIVDNLCTPEMQKIFDCDMTQVDTTISSCIAHENILFPLSKNCKDHLCGREDYFNKPSCLESACKDEEKMLAWVKDGSKDPQHQACFKFMCSETSKSDLCVNFKLNTLFSCLDYEETKSLDNQLAEAEKITKEKENAVKNLEDKLQEITRALEKAKEEAKEANLALDAAKESSSKDKENKDRCLGDLTTYKDSYLSDKLEDCNKDLAEKENKALLTSDALSQKRSELARYIKTLEIRFLDVDPSCNTELKRNGNIAYKNYKRKHVNSLEAKVDELEKANKTAHDALADSKDCKDRVEQSFVELAEQVKHRYLSTDVILMAQNPNFFDPLNL
ncbi:hypothetical protein DSO57_1030080 [Entomophthora muscae]|uniref:Uncharacterized protein n=1 Tax=Entomophthora muscae TaxID=34485 RepID=A0ACC2RRY5_9FUNG|nr:hypothetical protein DSO57_1030080 [Entomophthora muscae]